MAASPRSNIVFAFLVAIAIYVGFLLRHVLLLVYVSALFAVVINPAIVWIRGLPRGKFKIGRGLAVVLLLVLTIGLVALLLAFVIPPIYRDAKGLYGEWPNRVAELTDRINRIPFAAKLNFGLLGQHVAGAIGGAVGLFGRIAGGVAGIFSVILLTAYFILDGVRAFEWSMSLAPLEHRGRLRATMLRAETRMRHWLIGQFALMIILGVGSAIAFGTLGLKYFYAIALFAGLANFVPIIGPIATVVLAGVVALTDSLAKVAGVLIFYVVYQQLETAFLTPRIMKQTVDLPPLAIIIALAAGGALAGILGALVAVPSAALAAVLIDEYLVKPHAAEAAK